MHSQRIAFVGIDPGVSGAACLLCLNEKIHFHDFESIDRARETLQKWSEVYELKIIMEKVKSFAGEGHKGVFTFGRNYGRWEGLLHGLYLDFETVDPRTWQNCIFDGKNRKVQLPDKSYKKFDTKDLSIMTAQTYFPEIKKVCYLKKHNHRADALLLAYYLMIFRLGVIDDQKTKGKE
jgi:hypothetical protein